MLYAIIGLVVVAAILFFVLSKKKDEPEQIKPAPEDKKLPPKKATAKKAEPKPAPPDEDEEEEDEEEGEDEEDEEEGEDEEDEEEGEEEEASAPPAAAEEEEEEEPEDEIRPSLAPRRDVASLRKGLAKSRGEGGFFGRLRALVGGKREIDPEITDEIEEVLLTSDVGVKTTEALIARVRDGLEKGELGDTERVWGALRDEMLKILEVGEAGAFKLRARPTVVLMVGVNGAGKTTTIGKVATKLTREGRKVVLAAGDTFRAAAVQQLIVWGERVGCEVVRGKDGADPGSVVFDAVKKAEEIGADVVLADTAGRLHTKTNLMTEMTKIAKTAGKALDGAPHEVLLVLDATNGQNALAQAKEFKDALDLTGIVLTKLDGTAKGGVILGISDELELPVRFIGLGERADDLHDFVPDDFVEALLGEDAEESAA